MGIPDERAVDFRQCGFPFSPAAADGREPVVTHLLLCGAPDGFVECVICLVLPVLIDKRQTQIKIGLAVPRIGIFPDGSLDGSSEMALGLLEAASAQQQLAVGRVETDVARIAPESLQIIIVRQIGCVAVLLQMLSGQIQLLAAGNLTGRGSGLRRGRNRFDSGFSGGAGEDLPSGCAEERQRQLMGLQLRGNHGFQYFHRGKGNDSVQKQRSVSGQGHPCLFIPAGGVDTQGGLSGPDIETQHSLCACILDNAHLFVGHEVLGEGLFLIGCQPCEIGLIVGKHSGHQLNIRAVGIGQIPVPCLAEITAAPGPLLLAGRDMMIRNVQDTGLLSVVISAHEVVVRVVCHVGGGHRQIPVPRNIHTFGIVVLIVGSGGNGEPGDVPFAVIHHGGDVRGEDGLGIVVDGNRRICPPQEGLGQTGAVIQLTLDFDIGPVGIQGEGGDGLGAVHLIHIIDHHGAAAVRVFLYDAVRGRIGGGTVMLRPVEFNAAADPRSGQTDQSRLDDMVVIDEIVMIGLIVCALDPAAQFGQNHDLQVVIFEINRVIDLILLFVQNPVDDGIGIHPSRASLIDALFQEHRVFVRCTDSVGGDADVLAPDLDLACLMFHPKNLPDFFILILPITIPTGARFVIFAGCPIIIESCFDKMVVLLYT